MDESRKHSQHVILEIGALKDILALFTVLLNAQYVFSFMAFLIIVWPPNLITIISYIVYLCYAS